MSLLDSQVHIEMTLFDRLVAEGFDYDADRNCWEKIMSGPRSRVPVRVRVTKSKKYTDENQTNMWLEFIMDDKIGCVVTEFTTADWEHFQYYIHRYIGVQD